MLRAFFALVANFFALLVLPLWWVRRERAAGASGWLELKLEGSLAEFPSPSRRLLRARAKVALHEVRQALDQAAKDERVTGLQVTLASPTEGSASTQSWHGVLSKFQEQTGKPVVMYLPNGGGTREYYLGCASSRLLLGPDARLAPLGFAVEAPYLKEFLSRGGVEFEVFARGDFKTAAEPLVREEMSAAQRQQLEELLQHQFEWVCAGIERGRGVPRETVTAWFEQGPFGAQRALASGLVDALAYADEVQESLLPDRRVKLPNRVPLQRYARRRRRPFMRFSSPGYLAVVAVHGAITSEANGPFRVADEHSFAECTEKVRKDPRALGLLLHIDSRGGSALASARMLHEVRRCAAQKPVVAYFSNTAASGGYMIGVGAHEIVAQSTSITGSIGVVAARPVVQELLGRFGIKMEAVKRGERADMWSVARFMNPGARAALALELDEVYQRFLEQVASGRKMELSDVEAVAGGRIWSGEAARRHGLVDELGDCELALRRLRALIGTRAGQRANVRRITAHRRLFAKAPAGRFLNLWSQRMLGTIPGELAALTCDAGANGVLAWEPTLLSWGHY